MIKDSLFEIVSNEALKEDVFRLTMRGDTSAVTTPGQFVNIRLDGAFLRRPLSVCDMQDDLLTVVCKIKGSGTAQLGRMKKGELDVLTGLGNGFDLTASGERPLLIGGGLGFTPLYFLARKLLERNIVPTVILGFNEAAEVLYEEEFLSLGAKVITATANGSRGLKGFAADAMAGLDYSYFYSCGPEVMFRAVHEMAKTEGEFSFEQRMGCGFGACVGCTCKTVTGSKRICKDGPVLKRSEILWQT